jgi:phytoene synthase
MSTNYSDAEMMRFTPRFLEQATEKVIREHSKTFFFATGLLPRSSRKAIRALYAFCRATDDLVDSENATLGDLQNWRCRINLPLEQQDDLILYHWTQIREAYGVNRRYEAELIEGVTRDAQFHPYQTWENLQTYCYQVASTVGLLSMPIIGLADGVRFDQAAPYAIQLGIALQLTNILRDVGEDLTAGRVYFPLEDLDRFNLSLADIQQRTFDERFIALMQFEIARARQLYQQALPGIMLLSRQARAAVGAAALLYAAILDEIEAIGYDVFHHRAHTNLFKKVRMLPGILWRVNHLAAPRLD